MDLKQSKEIIQKGLAWANWTEQQQEAMRTAIGAINEKISRESKGEQVKSATVILHKKNAYALERRTDGKWLLDDKEISQEDAISELVEAVKDLGYWCQVAKDVLSNEQFELVQEASKH